MKNIGVIVDNDFNADTRVRKEVDILKKNGYHIYVLCFGFDNKEYENIPGINISRIRMKKRTKDTLFFFFNLLPLYENLWRKQVKKFVKNNSIEVLHVHDLYMSKSVSDAIKNTGKKVPIILDLHENFPHAIQSYNWTKGFLRNLLSKPKHWIKKEAEYLKYASKLIVLSEKYKTDLIEKFNFIKEKDIISFSNVIDLRQFEKFKINPKISKSNGVTLTYFGAVAERRGIFETIDALNTCIDKNINLNLLVIGPIDKADKERFLIRTKKNKNIRHIPWIDLSELVTYMKISDVFISPLHKNEQHESGVANKIYQYMFGAKPIIVSDCKPQKDLIESFNCGISYSTQEEFVSAIITLSQNIELRAELGENGFNNLYKHFDSKSYENKLINLYKEL
ncbi:MAG: glycosyl transferase family 1 [Flavobacteriales bacterium]|nr:glycosyl transferase family 1 [Flavobacteriales bacterium]|tara:strand:+ start:1321 stop:2502 length:1182 start_codon:yes stop_codon:yes gene_type:complete